MLTTFLTIFIITVFLCLSTYVFYPFAIWLLGTLFPFKVQKEDITPTVSIIIAAHNEAKNIKRKIENTLALEYPKGKLEILVGSDGSTDKTATLVKKYADQDIQLMDFKTNRGKTAVQNDLVKRSTGEILILTDAASFLHSDALLKITPGFADKRVGCVAGKMRFVDIDSNLTTQSQGLYWKYELKIRHWESSLGRLIGVDGPLYAVRRNSYIPLEHNIISDFITPLLILEQGKNVVFEPDALVDEAPTSKAGQEFTTRRRITLRGLVGLRAYGSKLLTPVTHPLLFCQIVFHKVLRWFVGPLIIINFLSCMALLGHWLFNGIFVLYIIFGIAAVLGFVSERLKLKIRLLTIPYYFSLVNMAATMGIIDFFRKKQAVTWKPVRE